MSVGPAATTVATCGAFELVEDGPRLVFVDRATNGIDIALFVLGLLAFIVGGNGIAWTIVAVTGGDGTLALVGAGFLVVVAIVIAVLVALVRARRRRKRAPLAEQRVLLVLDRAQGAVCNAQGQAIAPLAGIAVREAYQLGSSSKALDVACSAGVFTVARGSPFSGSIDDVAHALRQRGFDVR
jgi:hypothetical protein